jgi:perosamine synthetase
MQAAIGLVQLDRLDGMIARRREIADSYREVLPNLGIAFQQHPAGARVNEQTFGAVVPVGVDRDAFVAAMQDQGIGAGILSYALTRIGSLVQLGQSAPVAEEIVDRGFALPVHTGMSDEDVADVIAALGRVAGA